MGNIRDRVRVLGALEDIDTYVFSLRDVDIEEVKDIARRHMARSMAELILESDVLEETWTEPEKENDPFSRAVLRLRLTVIAPDEHGKHTFADEIDAAYRNGQEDLLSRLSQHAARYASLDTYGPVQALAMSGFVELIRREWREEREQRTGT